MSAPAKKKPQPIAANIRWGVLSKREAALELAKGTRHIHSTQLGEKDALLKATAKHAASGTVPKYSWEPREKLQSLIISSSSDRSKIIKKAVTDAELMSKRDLREKAEGVLEELITNGIYHAYHCPKGSEKYVRSKPVQLAEAEKLTLKCHNAPGGIYISIKDLGGNLQFEQVAAALARCYGYGTQQIETKEGGAGLGLYLVFEAATHLKIVTKPDEMTEISCWIADKGTFQANLFSFNFFEVKRG